MSWRGAHAADWLIHVGNIIGGILVSAASLELILFVGEEHVEARERAVAAADVALQLHLRVIGQVGGVHLLLERPQTVPQHDDLVEEGLDRPALLLQARRRQAAAPACRRATSRPGTAGVSPASSRIIRRSSSSRSPDVPSEAVMGGAILSRSLTMGNGVGPGVETVETVEAVEAVRTLGTARGCCAAANAPPSVRRGNCARCGNTRRRRESAGRRRPRR